MNQNDVILRIMRLTKSGAELRVSLYILCHTWGQVRYNEIPRLTLDELLQGRKRRDGTRIDDGTGLSKPAVLAGLRAATQHGLIATWTDRSGGGGRIKKLYSLKMKSAEVLTSGVMNVDPWSHDSLYSPGFEDQLRLIAASQ